MPPQVKPFAFLVLGTVRGEHQVWDGLRLSSKPSQTCMFFTDARSSKKNLPIAIGRFVHELDIELGFCQLQVDHFGNTGMNNFAFVDVDAAVERRIVQYCLIAELSQLLAVGQSCIG